MAESIAYLKSLQILDISSTRMTLTGILQLSSLSTLTKLNADNRISFLANNNVDFRPLKALQSLNLSSSSLTDGHLASIADMKRLSSLKISHNPITTQGIKHLGKMIHLKKLEMYCLNSEKINPIVYESLTGLTSLYIHNISKIERNRLICHLPHLVKLNKKILHRDNVKHHRAHLSKQSAQSTKSISVVSQITHFDGNDRASSSEEIVISTPDQSSQVNFHTPHSESNDRASSSEEVIISTPDQSSQVNFHTPHSNSNDRASSSEEVIISTPDQSSQVNFHTPHSKSPDWASGSEEGASSRFESHETGNFSTDKNQKKSRGLLSQIYTGLNNLINGLLRLLGFSKKFTS